MAPHRTQKGINCSDAEGARNRDRKAMDAGGNPGMWPVAAQHFDEIDDKDHAEDRQEDREDHPQEARREIAAEGEADHRGANPARERRAPARRPTTAQTMTFARRPHST